MGLTPSERTKRHYQKNRETILAGIAAKRKKYPEQQRAYDARKYARTKAILDAARTGPCVDCGLQLPPECMDFDHVRGEKRFSLSVPYAKGRSEEAIMAEIAKCEIRCPSCHRLRHHNERVAAR